MLKQTDIFLDWVLSVLISKTKPDLILLFGSRARGDALNQSDYDIAIDGINVTDGVWSDISNYIRDKKPSLHTVDLVRLDRVNPELRQRIQKEGIILHQKKKSHE